MAYRPTLVAHKTTAGPAAVLFVHGFGGNAATTWGGFPSLLANEPRLASWSVYSIGYSTSLTFDVAGFWSADPELITLGGYISTVLGTAPLARYEGLALLAHSMGGLLVQRALLSHPELARRITHLLLYGTPSDGLSKASPFRFWKRQVRDMAQGSPFIRSLRREWSAAFDPQPSFTFLAVAGDRDEFVPRASSLGPFPVPLQRVVNGNHLQIVKPENDQHLGFRVAVNALVGEKGGLGPFDSARLAVESRRFQVAIETLGRHREELDEQGVVTLALALESVGRQQEAIQLLTTARPSGTDAMGVLAGRLKRRWLVEHRKLDAEKALALYQDALALAREAQDAPQAYYHAINVAFMELAYRKDPRRASELARVALEYCARAPRSVWRLATEAEAALYLDDPLNAANLYRQTVALGPSPREADSMYQQGIRVADLVRQDALLVELQVIFGRRSAAMS